MSVYVLGDLHLSFGTNKPMDVFGSKWDRHYVKIEENWQQMVRPEDTVVINGDISWGMNLKGAYWDFDYIQRLNGSKLILKGNHDYWWETASKMNRFCEESGFTSISFLHNNAVRVGDLALCGSRGWFLDEEDATGHNQKMRDREALRLAASLEAGQKTGAPELVAFLHYPPVYPGFLCQEILDVLKRYQVKRCFYGHLHGPSHQKAVLGQYDGVEFTLTSCDFTDFKPIFVG